MDARVARWLPAWPADRPPVTLRQLLTHTAGVREVRLTGTARTPQLSNARTRQDSIEAFIVADSGDFRAGSAFRYSNAAFFLLGRVVERVSAMPLVSRVGVRSRDVARGICDDERFQHDTRNRPGVRVWCLYRSIV